MLRRFLPAVLLTVVGLASSVAFAQTAGTITFAVEVTTAASGTVTPKATWSTTPAATSCSAAGGWTGTKVAAGSETLAPVSQSAVYRLDCSWGDSKATVSWTPPTTNTAGATLTDLAGFRTWYGTDPANLTTAQAVASPSATSMTISPLAAGKWYFAVEAFTASGAESLLSTVVSKTTGTGTATKSVSLAVNIPAPPTNVTVQ